MFTDQLLPQGTILISPVEILARFHKVCPRTCITLIKKQQQPNSKTTIKTRCKINKPLPSITNPFDPLQTSSLYYKPLPPITNPLSQTSSLYNLFTPLQTSSLYDKPLPSITNLFPPLQTSSLHYKPLPSITNLFPLCQISCKNP